MTAKTTIKLYKANEIDARIVLLHKNGQRLQTEMHKLACSVLLHVGESGDVRVVQKFLAAMPEMSRTNGLRNWFEQFGPVKFNVSEDGVETVVHVKGGKTKLGDAMAKPFWKFSAKEGQPYEPIDMQKYIEQQMKKLEKDAEKTGRDHSAVLAALKMAVTAPAVQ